MLQSVCRLARGQSRLLQQSVGLLHGGHFDEAYDHLIDHMNEKYIVPLPRNEVLYEILSRVVDEHDALFLSRFPSGYSTHETLLAAYGDQFSTMDELKETLERCIHKGMIQSPLIEGTEFFFLPEMVVGWFEHIWMVDNRGDMPVDELAQLFDEYLLDYGVAFTEDQESISDLRALCREDVIPEGIKILDYESARRIVENAGRWAVATCTCTNMYNELNPENPSPLPKRRCLVLGERAVGGFGKYGLVEEITKDESMEILEMAQDLGMVQSTENVQTDPVFMCNCDQVTCLLYQTFRRIRQNKLTLEDLDYRDIPLQTSNYIANVDLDACIGCGTCKKMCVMDAYDIIEDKSKLIEEICIGCGVCATKCPSDAIYMTEREARKYTPEEKMDMILYRYVTRKRLHCLVPEGQKGRGFIRFLENIGLTKMKFFRNRLLKAMKKKAVASVRGQFPKEEV